MADDVMVRGGRHQQFQVAIFGDDEEVAALSNFIADGGDPHEIEVIEEFYGVTHD